MPLPLAALAGWAIKAGGTYVLTKAVEWGIEKARNVANQAFNNVGPVAPDLVRGAAIARGQGRSVVDSELRGRQLSFSNTVADWTRSLVASQQQIVQYNGVMRSAQMSLEAERIGRDMRKGAATQSSFSELARSQDRLERARLPLEIAKQNADNRIAAAANREAAALLEKQIEMSQTLKEIRDNLKKEAADPWLNQIALQLARQAGPPRVAPAQPGKNGGAF
jgi:hypothetical protein